MKIQGDDDDDGGGRKSDGGDSEGTLPVRLQVWKAILEHEVEGKYEEAKKVYDSVLAKNDTMKASSTLYVVFWTYSALMYSSPTPHTHK